MTLWIVRHGRTEANAAGLLLGRADPSLDAVGAEQARRIAAVLPAGAQVLTSPLERTRATAAAFSVDARIDERLVELDYGEFDEMPFDSISPAVWSEWRADPDFRPPGGESLSDLSARVASLLNELAPTARTEDVVLFTHVSPIKAAVAWALGVGIEISWRCHVAQASISRVGVSKRGPSLHSFNDVSHLPD